VPDISASEVSFVMTAGKSRLLDRVLSIVSLMKNSSSWRSLLSRGSEQHRRLYAVFTSSACLHAHKPNRWPVPGPRHCCATYARHAW